MKRLNVRILLSTMLFTLRVFAQSEGLVSFAPLINTTWEAEGKWGDGSPFKQKIQFESSLDSNIVLTKSWGYVDAAQTQIGLRNQGIRSFDKETKEVKFWEFDVFGGITQGQVLFIEKDILYHYQYGDYFITDAWEYENDSTYVFKVGSYKDGAWKQVYLETQFKKIGRHDKQFLYEQLKAKLIGKWTSKAWDGTLNEEWSFDNNNQLVQTAHYLENGKVLYEAANKMEFINDELILCTIIKGGNPKIFKATSISENEVVFENSDYANPNKIVYQLEADGSFQRIISGIEREKVSQYTFQFKKLE